jgi:hypothetical protein
LLYTIILLNSQKSENLTSRRCDFNMLHSLGAGIALFAIPRIPSNRGPRAAFHEQPDRHARFRSQPGKVGVLHNFTSKERTQHIFYPKQFVLALIRRTR